VKVLVTGAAGFIGMSCAIRFLERGDNVVGLDNLNDYYDPKLKSARLKQLKKYSNFSFHGVDINEKLSVDNIFEETSPEAVLNLAAQVGVRYSLENPSSYVSTNLMGFVNILEACRQWNVQHLVYASSSSVYGINSGVPFSEHENISHPLSIYAATKKANELMAHTYSHLYNLPTTGLRFFTVYGPWGRPDMAPHLFVDAIIQKRPINIYNNGNMARDFSYVDDIVEGIIRVIDKPATPDDSFNSTFPDPAISSAPYRIFNIGNGRETPLMDFIVALEDALGMKAQKNFMEMQPGDMKMTVANTEELGKWTDFRPNTTVVDGVKKFVTWYIDYYGGSRGKVD
jgi:UDP-glucuronate 4-epimerase